MRECTFSIRMLENALHKSITEKYWQSSGIADNKVCGFGTTGCRGITILFIALRSCTNLHPFPFGFFTGKIGELQGLVHGIISPLLK